MASQDPNGWYNWCTHNKMYWYAWHFQKRKDPIDNTKAFRCDECTNKQTIKSAVPVVESTEEQLTDFTALGVRPLKKRGRPRKEKENGELALVS